MRLVFAAWRIQFGVFGVDARSRRNGCGLLDRLYVRHRTRFEPRLHSVSHTCSAPLALEQSSTTERVYMARFAKGAGASCGVRFLVFMTSGMHVGYFAETPNAGKKYFGAPWALYAFALGHFNTGHSLHSSHWQKAEKVTTCLSPKSYRGATTLYNQSLDYFLLAFAWKSVGCVTGSLAQLSKKLVNK